MQTTTAIKDEPMSTANIRRTAAAATIGNILEIYDFIVFGIFAIPISKVFFPPMFRP